MGIYRVLQLLFKVHIELLENSRTIEYVDQKKRIYVFWLDFQMQISFFGAETTRIQNANSLSF